MSTTSHPVARGPVVNEATSAAVVDDLIRRRIGDCAYRFCFNQVSWRLVEGRLVLEGRVPSFYLKQVLQTLLRDLDCIEHIDNQVVVVSATGLSTPADNR
ncbi:MAG: hypothetical protein AB7F89_05425 [Pirellulaceae bacterium]